MQAGDVLVYIKRKSTHKNKLEFSLDVKMKEKRRKNEAHTHLLRKKIHVGLVTAWRGIEQLDQSQTLRRERERESKDVKAYHNEHVKLQIFKAVTREMNRERKPKKGRRVLE
jgi:hypothetical protein